MDAPQVFESEYRFCQILWENEPINSTKLVKLCAEKLGWSKGTTYTVIRRLAQRGIVQNKDAVGIAAASAAGPDRPAGGKNLQRLSAPVRRRLHPGAAAEPP